MIIKEFFQSPSWRDIQTRVIATLGFSGIGTASTALPSDVLVDMQVDQLIHLEILTRWLAVGSYILSSLVALTVLTRFVIWLYDRYKNNNK